MPRLRAALVLALSIGLWPTCGLGQPQKGEAGSSCDPIGRLAFICGAERPEDLARIPGTGWLITSGFSPGAGLKLVDTRARTLRRWYAGAPDQIRWDRARYPTCPGQLDPGLFNARGLSLRTAEPGRRRLYVVNHGGRESIEIFDIDARRMTPGLTWRGCVPMPAGYVANSVAAYSDGTVLATVLTRPGTTIADFVNGRNTGGVFQWRPGERAFQLIPGTELPGNNGLETSRDDREFYVVAFGWRAVVAFQRDRPSIRFQRMEAPDFMPDNIHRDGDRLVAAGMRYDEPACGGVRKIVDGVADPMLCHRGYTVAALDPKSGRWEILSRDGPNAAFSGVSTGVVIDDAVWLGSFQADRLAIAPRTPPVEHVTPGEAR